MTLQEVITYLAYIGEIPGLWFRVALALISAILLGFFLEQDWKSWMKVAVTFVVYLFFQEWVRSLVIGDYNSTTYSHSFYRPLIISLISIVVFLSGIGIGVFIAEKTIKTKIYSDSEIQRLISLIAAKEVNYEKIAEKILPSEINPNDIKGV